MSLGKYILRDGEPVAEPNVLKWAEWFEKTDRSVGKTTVGDVQISTVFLGVDHQWDDGPPLLFETMVFGGDLDEEQKRYATLDEAKAGHQRMVEQVLRLMTEPKTICVKCKWHQWGDLFERLFCDGQSWSHRCGHGSQHAKQYVSPAIISGVSCSSINTDGNCPHYEAKVSWWRRIFRFRG
jgi:hypothetical protein